MTQLPSIHDVLFKYYLGYNYQFESMDQRMIQRLYGPKKLAFALNRISKQMMVDTLDLSYTAAAFHLGISVELYKKICKFYDLDRRSKRKRTTYSDIKKLFGHSACYAALQLGLTMTTFQRVYKKFGIKRWSNHRAVTKAQIMSYTGKPFTYIMKDLDINFDELKYILKKYEITRWISMQPYQT